MVVKLGYVFTIRPALTVVYRRENFLRGVPFKVFDLPHLRYSFSADRPASGMPGRIEFEHDVRSLIASELVSSKHDRWYWLPIYFW